MTVTGNTDLWAFALDFYGRPGIAEACLALQDHEGLNVNLLLWCCFLARRGHALTPESAGAASDRVAPWNRRVTAPLRAVRRAVKNAAEPGASVLYQLLKQTELEAERVELALLQEIADQLASAPAPAGAHRAEALALENLAAYLKWAGKDPHATPFPAVLANMLVTEAENR